MLSFLPKDVTEKRQRLNALRKWLKEQGYDGLFVPHEDEFQGEIIPPERERLAWLTGFSGSAGLGLITQNSAVLFVDGRYTLQSHLQVDTETINIASLETQSLATWLNNNLCKEKILLYDPWLHTLRQLEQLEEAARDKGIKLQAIHQNPIDLIWQDKPFSNKSEIMPHALEFTGMAHTEKVATVQNVLSEKQIDGVWLGAPDSVSWLLNIRAQDLEYAPLVLAFAFVPQHGKVTLFVDARQITKVSSEWLASVANIADPKIIEDFIKQQGQEKRRIQIDPTTVPIWFEQNLTKEGAIVVEAMDPCFLPKACKNKLEQKGARQAHRRDGIALCQFLMWLEKIVGSQKITETGAADKLLAYREKNSLFRSASFRTMSAMGTNGSIIHYRPIPGEDAVLVPKGIYLFDSGGQYLDGTTDVTRPVAMGPVTQEQRENYTRVLKGHIALGTIMFPEGTTGSQLDVLARQFLWKVGLDYNHSTGHGVGSYLNVHEGPQRISKTPNPIALKPGMIVSNEPAYYKEKEYGIRIENLVMVVPSDKPDFLCFETLTLVPYDKRLIEPSLLTQSEKQWLNNYHQRVFSTLAPLVESDLKKWLKEKTQPIVNF